MRLVTRADLDGLACAVLISSAEAIDEVRLIHPQDITDKTVDITRADILANLPYHSSCGKWFDHHPLTASNERPPALFEGRYALAPSAARVVYDHYVIDQPSLRRHERLVSETDRMDAAQLTVEDVTNPQDYILLGFTLDPRSGLGAYQDYFHKLLGWLRERPIDEVMEEMDVTDRVERLREQDFKFRKLTLLHSRQDSNVVITDFRRADAPPVGNRFLVYTLFPQANVSVRVHWGPRRERVAVVAGHSIFNRTSRTNVGWLLSRYGGGGHRGAGSCLLDPRTADSQIAEIVAAMVKDG
jgi:nanoRNase/pAp phosphatase (c-di-AMP/oligoRNAs hydrolase)